MPYIRLNKHYIHLPYLFLGITEAVILGLSVWLAQGLSGSLADFQQSWTSAEINWPSIIVFSVIFSCCTLSMGVYTALVREGFSSMVLRTLVSFFLLGSLCLMIINWIFGDELIGQRVGFWSVIIATALVLVVRCIFVRVVDTAKLKRRVVIFGAGVRAKKLLEELEPNRASLGVEIVGCVASPNDEVVVEQSLRLPEPKEWVPFVKKLQISEIIIAPDERRHRNGDVFPLSQFLDCKLAGTPSCDGLSFYERELGKIDISLLQPSWMLFSDGFKYSNRGVIAKRLFDLVLASLFFIVLWPFMLLTAIAVKLESPGAILYHQVRVGQNGKPFRIYKFRSMRQDAEKAGKAIWAQKNDSRITRVGAFIRNTRLDELPQLYNVLAGHMSFVGPRPERPEFVNDLGKQIPFYDTRHKVKPGLMGWAQLKYPYGASVEDAKNKLQYDLYYTKNHSFLMDILIMIQTVEIILLGKGVH
ncbi:MAG TPA: TIGR03013 family XrtA/PEP-CTERM system glycosyltransferase [Cellvibrio sp.]|nr:TIGR03013 family XrtA/PEP-CTERM system glycosyltransferase [Cellvibrio sp.]